jgi:hypothetical protein
MHLDLSPAEANFLAAQLAQHIQRVETELVHTDKHQLQRSIAADLGELRNILVRLTIACSAERAAEMRP